MMQKGISKHFVINSAGNVFTLVVSLIIVPIYVHQVGDARYGIISIVWLLLGYFGFLDLGLSRASTNLLSQLSHSSDEERTRVVATSLILNLVLGCIGSVILYVSGAFLLETIVSVPAELKPEISGSLPWVAILLPLALVSGVAVGTLEARERFAAANVLQVISTTIGQVAPVVCAVLLGPELTIVIPAAVLSRAFGVLLILAYVALFNGPWTSIRFHKATSRQLLGYGGWVTISSVASPILQSLDQFVIGSNLGVAAITYYAIPMNLVMRSQLFAAALSRTLFPRMSRLNPSESKAVSEASLVTLSFGYAALCAPAIILAKPFISLWISQPFGDIAGPIAQVLLIGGWINGLAFIPFSLLQAQGRPDLTAKFHLLEIIPFIGILWFLSSAFGLMGAAVAWTLRVGVDAALLAFATRISVRTLARIAPAALCMLVCYAIVGFVSMTFWQAFAAAVVAGCSVVGLAMYFDLGVRSLLLRFRKGVRDDAVRELG
ncbi:flippase [Microvirga sp. HBU67558]|nr:MULTISPECIES: flippase [unclassified Microvirga]MBQ0820528.1 flippase [Microvirga sp. HBU67558]